MTTYNKDQEYILKVVNTDNEVKEIKYTPDKDMSKPQLIMALKSKYKNFFKLLESKQNNKYVAIITVMDKYNKGKQGYLGKDDIVSNRDDALKFDSRNDVQQAIKKFAPKNDYTVVKTNVEKIKLDESSKTNSYVKSYNETDYGWGNNVTNLFGELTDGNWYVFNTEVGNVEIFDSPITDKFIDTMYNYDTDDELADDTWYDTFQKEHNITNSYDRDRLNIIDNELRTRYYDQSDMLEEDNKKLSDLIDFASSRVEFKGFTKEIFKYIEQNLTKEFGDEWYKKSLIDLEDATYDIVEQYCTRVIDDDSINPTDFYKVVLDYVRSKEDMKVESMEKFDTLVIDNTGNSMLLKGASYNNACYWLEQKLAKENDRIESTSTDTVNTNITVIRTAKNKKFQYDESDGTLRLLEEYNLTEATKMLKFKLLPTSLQKKIWNIEEMYQENKLNSDDDVFEDTEDEYADEVLQQNIYDLLNDNDMKIYMSDNYDTTTQDSLEKVVNLVANKIYEAILDENTDSLFGVENTDTNNDNNIDPYEFIANVDALYDRYGENKLPSGCTVQLSLGNKYLFSDEYHNGEEPVCCNGEHCRLMWAYNGVYGVKNLHFDDCSFELTKEEFLLLSSYTVPLDESKNMDSKVKSIVDSINIKKGDKQEYNYSNSLKFVIYRDKEYDDIYQVYTYLGDKILDYLDTGDVNKDELYNKLTDIVNEVHKELKETVNMIVETKDSDLSIEYVIPNYTGGGIYVYTGKLKDGNYFIASDDWFDTDTKYFTITIVNENPDVDYDNAMYEEWQQEHLVRDIENEKEAQDFTKQLLKWVVDNKPSSNYSMEDINKRLSILDESKDLKDSVIVVDYGSGTRFPDRETAIKFYKECVVGTDPNSSEHYRYLTILWELENSKNTIVYDSDDEEEYNWWVSKGKPIEDISQELLDAHKLD